MDNTTSILIISRHPAAIEFIARHLARGYGVDGYHVNTDSVVIDRYDYHEGPHDPSACHCERWSETVNVVASATAEDVAGKVVYGNIPLHLAAAADSVWAVEFDGPPPRGAEYGIAEMEQAGARLCCYKVQQS